MFESKYLSKQKGKQGKYCEASYMPNFLECQQSLSYLSQRVNCFCHQDERAMYSIRVSGIIIIIIQIENGED